MPNGRGLYTVYFKCRLNQLLFFIFAVVYSKRFHTSDSWKRRESSADPDRWRLFAAALKSSNEMLTRCPGDPRINQVVSKLLRHRDSLIVMLAMRPDGRRARSGLVQSSVSTVSTVTHVNVKFNGITFIPDTCTHRDYICLTLVWGGVHPMVESIADVQEYSP